MPSSPSLRPLDGSGRGHGFLRWAAVNERWGLCFEPSLPGAGGPPLGPRPQQEESQPDWMSTPAPPPHPPPHLGRLAFLNLSFLHCKRGTKAPILAGMCDFGRLTGGSDPACSRSCSEDRGPGWCRERAEQSSSRTCLGLPGLSPVASPTLYDFPSLPLSSPRDNQNSQAPFPLHREGN